MKVSIYISVKELRAYYAHVTVMAMTECVIGSHTLVEIKVSPYDFRIVSNLNADVFYIVKTKWYERIAMHVRKKKYAH